MSITFTDNTSAVLVNYKRDKGTPNVEVLTIPATADATQGDYVVLSNVWGDELGLWLDIDEDGTEPTGAVYSALASTAVVPIATGGTAAENAESFVAVLLGGTFSDAYRVVDNEDGTITLTSIIGGVVAEADPHNTDDSGVGSITSTVTTIGTATTTVRQDSYVKGIFSIVADTNRNVIVFNQSAANGVGFKGMESTAFPYAEVTSPSSTSVLDLKAQLDTMNTPGYSLALSDIVVGEAAKAGEFTGTNDTFTTTNAFLANSESVVYNQVVLTRGVDYTPTPTTGTIVFTFDPSPADSGTLTFNYIKA
jgi:hypothetical protein